MGRPQEPLDRDGSPIREFAFWLRDLRRRSGLTYEDLAKAANYATSTMLAAAAGKRLPTLPVTMAFVGACRGDKAAWRSYWAQAQRLLDTGAPGSAGQPVAPPWATAVTPAARGLQASQGLRRAERQPAADGWYIEDFTALLRLDVEPIEALEQRKIVATADGLTELVTSVSVPRHPGDPTQPLGLETELLYGGFLQARQQPYDGYFENVIALSRPLGVGDRHQYGLRVRLPAGQLMNSHYVHLPRRRSDHFELRIRFGSRLPPGPAWVVRAAPPPVIYRREPTSERLIPDRFGEVSASFSDLRVGLGYGICWPDVALMSPGS
jgi:DNA-binding XRE family transcriptional regulator